MTLSLRLPEEDAKLIKQCAQFQGISVSDFIRRTVIESIEDEYDLKAFDAAMAKYKANPVTYSLEEVERMMENME